MRMFFKTGTQLYVADTIAYDASPIYRPVVGKYLEEDFNCEAPEKDYGINIGGQYEKPVSKDTMIHYKDEFYLRYGDGELLFTGLSPDPTIKDSATKYKHYIIAGIAIIAIIGFIWYKHKHK